jgi:hypothetical protein
MIHLNMKLKCSPRIIKRIVWFLGEYWKHDTFEYEIEMFAKDYYLGIINEYILVVIPIWAY